MATTKNILIGSIDNYTWENIKVWATSFSEANSTAKKILLCYNIDKNTLDKLKSLGFVLFQSRLTDQIVIQRFYDIWQILTTLQSTDGYVLMTDVKDVWFQTCPFGWLENSNSNSKLICSSENISYLNETWSNLNVLQCYGQNVLNLLKEKTIYNAGVIAGKFEFIKNMCLNIYLLSKAAKSHNPDQTAYNILLNTLLSEIAYIPTEKEAWAAQLGTTLDPHKNYLPYNIEPNPKFQNSSVVNSLDIQYSIVHQYDRVPAIAEFVANKYKN